MSSKDKDNTLSKMRQFFRSKNSEGNFKEKELWPELEKELRPENPVTQRCKALKLLGDMALTTRFEDTSLKKLWDLTKDLIVDNKSTEHRHITLTFYGKLIQGQYENLSLMREHFFLVIQKHAVSEDLGHRLELLEHLTDNGKDIKGFEEKIGQFMIEWEEEIVQGGYTIAYLKMLVNIIKFNAAHLDDPIIKGVIQKVCCLSCTTNDAEIALKCLQVVDAIICYAILPNEMLPICIATLCRTVNSENYCQTSWKVMKNLLGTNSGYSSLLTMCSILNDRDLYEDGTLIRGAVFHMTMGLWGLNSSIVHMHRNSPATVLRCFLNALTSQKIIVTYEVTLSVKMLIRKCGKAMLEHTWDVLCDILFAISDNIMYYEKNNLKKECILLQCFHETIDTIEGMLKEEVLFVNSSRMYDLIEKIADDRPEKSILKLIDYRASKITATRPRWLDALHNFVDRFYKIPSTKIRVKIINCIVKIMNENRYAYEEEILERVVIPHFACAAQEIDIEVRTAVAKALIEFALHCETKRCGEILEILGKLLNRPFDLYIAKEQICSTGDEMEDVLIIVQHLIEAFLFKLYRLPSNHAVKIFDLLVGHLELHYLRPKVFEQFNPIRLKIFDWMLKARANETYHIGFPDAANSGKIRFSHYLGVDSSQTHVFQQKQQQLEQEIQEPHQYQEQQQPQHQLVDDQLEPEKEQEQDSQLFADGNVGTQFTAISIRRACKIIVTCLESERDFTVLKHVLKELPNILQNKILICGSDIESFANILVKLFYDKKYIDYMTPYAKPTSDDLHCLILPVIAGLVIYHNFLSPTRQLTIINALKLGIPSRAATVCINTLTIMILEMPETLMKQLPDVLLEMSKMSDTASVAIPVLEFLSILSRLPNHLFVNFVPRHYMYVFAISLPYTKPQRYDHYTVSLAYLVIAGWFLKCKLPLRKNFVRYIIASIQSNTHLHFEDVNKSRGDFNPVNEDSTNRKRSSSLTERGSRGRDRPAISSQSQNSDLKPLINEKLKSFHVELAETCIDFIARHTFSPCSALPKRLHTAEYFLKDAPTQTWLVGHNLITITTSGCSTRPTRNGLCDHCAQQCRNFQSFARRDTSSNSNTILSSPDCLSSERVEGFDFPQKQTSKPLFSTGMEHAGADTTSTTSSSSQQKTHFSGTEGKVFRPSFKDGPFSSSSGSLDALSRRGSNPDSIENRDSNSLLGNTLQQQFSQNSNSSTSIHQPICACSCTGWAEIYIRRPTGCISWIMRIQNPIANDCLGSDMSIHDLITLFLPSQQAGVLGTDIFDENSAMQQTTVIPPTISEFKKASLDLEGVRKNGSETSNALAKTRVLKRQEEVVSSATGPIDIPKQPRCQKETIETLSGVHSQSEDIFFEDGDSRSRNPVRRVNSSPEMSTNWRNPFSSAKVSTKSSENLHMNDGAIKMQPVDKEDLVCVELDPQQKKKGFSKDMRVSCDAIPEEIAGSTPPNLAQTTTLSELLIKHLPDQKKQEYDPLFSLHYTQQSAGSDSSLSTVAIGATSNLNLKCTNDLQKIISKPPQLPVPLSPRLLARNAANKIAPSASITAVSGNGSDNNGSNDKYRSRSKTISSVREMNRTIRPTTTFGTANASRLTINPSFVFLQLYYTGQLQVTETPIKVNQDNMKKIDLLDLIAPFETYKIGVLYVGPGQCNNETEILKNRSGSARYVEFLRNLGTLVSLKDAKENNLFINMESNGRDGNFTYVWKDDIVQVCFHVATLMPNKEKDPNCNEKKKHIGNDFVTIVFNESGEEYSLNTISENKGHLADLIRNQTSILDGTINVMKRDHQTIDKKFQRIEANLNHVASQIDAIRNAVQDEAKSGSFTLLLLQAVLLTTNFQPSQGFILDALTSTQQGRLGRHLLFPDQLKDVMTTIRANLPASLILLTMLDDILHLYNLISLEGRVTAKHVIFKLKVPLIVVDDFDLFSVIPVPVKTNNSFIAFRPSFPFLMVNLHRDYYYPLSESQLRICLTLNGRYLCQQHFPLYTIGSSVAACEIRLLNRVSLSANVK